MAITKNLGIWMDHANAHLMEFESESMETKTIESKFINQLKEHSTGKNENLKHNKEQHSQTEFYKKLGEAIKNYEEVILFGPTNAKMELFNILRADHQFAGIKIEIEQADKMTDNQQRAFVSNFFSKRKLK